MKFYRALLLALAFSAPVLLLGIASFPRYPAAPARLDHNREVDRILHRSCADCHSFETHWPWYTAFSPAGVLLWYDVKTGRQHLNFSIGLHGHQQQEIIDALDDGSMPPKRYLWLHPQARLSTAEKDKLAKTYSQ